MVSRPLDGRPIEAVLRGAGYEVHRTPLDGDLESLVLSLRPRLVMIALNLPWGNATTAVQRLVDRDWAGSILLLEAAGTVAPWPGLPRLPLGVGPNLLLETIDRLISLDTGDCGE